MIDDVPWATIRAVLLRRINAITNDLSKDSATVRAAEMLRGMILDLDELFRITSPSAPSPAEPRPPSGSES